MIPGLGEHRRQPIDASLLHQCFSLPSSLSKSNEKKKFSGEDEKKE